MTTTTSDKKWYVVRAVSGQEAKIKDYIMSEVSRFGYDNLVEDILVPTEKVIQIRNGKKINKERVYFPGYIMIKANLTGELPHIIKSVTNVIGFLGLLQPLADGLKLFVKETILPSNSSIIVFLVAPMLTFILSLIG